MLPHQDEHPLDFLMQELAKVCISFQVFNSLPVALWAPVYGLCFLMDSHNLRYQFKPTNHFKSFHYVINQTCKTGSSMMARVWKSFWMIYSATLIATIVVSSRLNGTHSVIALEANTNGPKGLPVSSSFADPRD